MAAPVLFTSAFQRRADFTGDPIQIYNTLGHMAMIVNQIKAKILPALVKTDWNGKLTYSLDPTQDTNIQGQDDDVLACLGNVQGKFSLEKFAHSNFQQYFLICGPQADIPGDVNRLGPAIDASHLADTAWAGRTDIHAAIFPSILGLHAGLAPIK